MPFFRIVPARGRRDFWLAHVVERDSDRRGHGSTFGCVGEGVAHRESIVLYFCWCCVDLALFSTSFTRRGFATVPVNVLGIHMHHSCEKGFAKRFVYPYV